MKPTTRATPRIRHRRGSGSYSSASSARQVDRVLRHGVTKAAQGRGGVRLRSAGVPAPVGQLGRDRVQVCATYVRRGRAAGSRPTRRRTTRSDVGQPLGAGRRTRRATCDAAVAPAVDVDRGAMFSGMPWMIRTSRFEIRPNCEASVVVEVAEVEVLAGLSRTSTSGMPGRRVLEAVSTQCSSSQTIARPGGPRRTIAARARRPPRPRAAARLGRGGSASAPWPPSTDLPREDVPLGDGRRGQPCRPVPAAATTRA